MKIKVMVVDGIVDTVMSSNPDMDVDVEIVNYDKMTGSHEQLLKEYEEDGMEDIPFNTKDCEDEEEEYETYDEDPYEDYEQEDLYDDYDEFSE